MSGVLNASHVMLRPGFPRNREVGEGEGGSQHQAELHAGLWNVRDELRPGWQDGTPCCDHESLPCLCSAH